MLAGAGGGELLAGDDEYVFDHVAGMQSRRIKSCHTDDFVRGASATGGKRMFGCGIGFSTTSRQSPASEFNT